MALLGGSLPKVTVREKPTLLPLSWVKAGTPPINGMALYEGSAPSEARKLYYAFAGAQAEEVVTTVGAASVGVALEVASTANLTAGMVIRIDNPAPQPDSFARIATIVDATNVTLQQAVNAAAGAPVLVTNILAVAGAVNPAAATIPVDSTAALYQGQTIVIDNPNSADAIVTVTGVQAGTITVDTPVRVEANAYLRSYWTTDVPFVALNHAFDAVGAVKVFADSVNGTTEATPRNLNLIFQGTVGGNTDLYYARVKVDPRPATDTRSTRPLVLQPLILSDAPDQATGVITEALAPNSMTKPMFFTGGRYRAWWLRVAADARQLKLTVKTKGGTTDTVTMDAWMDKPAAWPADGELVDVFGALDPIREYPLEYTSLNGRLYRIGFNPYTGTARILRQPATDPETVSTVSITGVPRVQRLTNHYAPDVQPIVSVERWRTWDGAPDYGPGSSLQAAPRVWLYWTRQHDDALGSRVYYRTWRMVNAGTAANPIITRLDTEARSETNPQNMDMPERMLPMEVLSPDGTATVVRQSAGVTSPEAGLWVLTTASRDLWPLYPNAGEREMTRHDLFLQVINVPAPDR
ncbi:MAG: hypothetical protein BWY76_02465 [bacterium ADurb.Bin429]|nr:MAG: hypothetical protein BWY76_02465 [bacterium ADurb.Bin429]